MSIIAPLVSIVLPTYNGSKYIRASIDSCLRQTYGNIELIIVDDGSTDNTPEIIRSYDDKRIRLIRHEKNKNLPNALNTGFANAMGDYLTWTSDDNYYADNAIEKMVSFLNTNECDFVYCDFYMFNDQGTMNRIQIPMPDTLELASDNGVGACFLYKRRVMEAIGEYDPGTRLAEDYDYWIRVSKHFKMRRLPEPIYYFRSHEGSLSSVYSKHDDIKVMAILVRMKNGLADIDRSRDAVEGIIVDHLLARDKNRLMNRALSMISRRMSAGKDEDLERNVYLIMVKLRYSRRIAELLKSRAAESEVLELIKNELKSLIIRGS